MIDVSLQVGLEVCGKCGLSIEGTSIIVAGESFHATCFICGECEAPIIDKFYTQDDGRWVAVMVVVVVVVVLVVVSDCSH